MPYEQWWEGQTNQGGKVNAAAVERGTRGETTGTVVRLKISLSSHYTTLSHHHSVVTAEQQQQQSKRKMKPMDSSFFALSIRATEDEENMVFVRRATVLCVLSLCHYASAMCYMVDIMQMFGMIVK